MQPHEVYKFRTLGEVLGAGHSTGENDGILLIRAVELHIGLELAIGKVSLNCNLM